MQWGIGSKLEAPRQHSRQTLTAYRPRGRTSLFLLAAVAGVATVYARDATDQGRTLVMDQRETDRPRCSNLRPKKKRTPLMARWMRLERPSSHKSKELPI